MKNRILVIAPHPDDETLGCGGTLLRMAEEGASIAWLIVTAMSRRGGFSDDDVQRREREIEDVSKAYGFCDTFRLRLPTRQLDALPMAELVAEFSSVFKSFQPQQVMLPYRMDVHTDHRVVFDAGAACSKWFRYSCVTKVLAYETLSETEFTLDARSVFQPNYYVDITRYLEQKIEIMSIYRSEISDFPFPRSAEAIRALATLRGSSSGFRAAEAFQLMRERV